MHCDVLHCPRLLPEDLQDVAVDSKPKAVFHKVNAKPNYGTDKRRRITAKFGPEIIIQLVVFLFLSCSPQTQDQFQTNTQEFQLRSGSVCSGTACEIAASKAFEAAFPSCKDDGKRGPFLPHEFVCDIDDSSQTFMRKAWGDDTIKKMFSDVMNFDSDEKIENSLDGSMHYIKDLACDILWGGFPCVDATTLAPTNSAPGKKSCIKDASHKTGSIFNKIIADLTRVRPACCILENVIGLKYGGPSGKSNLASCEALLMEAGYYVITIELNSLFLSVAQSRPRLYLVCLSVAFVAKLIARHGKLSLDAALEQLRVQMQTRMDRFCSLFDVMAIDAYLLDDNHPEIQSYLRGLPPVLGSQRRWRN